MIFIHSSHIFIIHLLIYYLIFQVLMFIINDILNIILMLLNDSFIQLKVKSYKKKHYLLYFVIF